MTKHTLKDFLDGRICVRCANRDDKQRLLQFCDDNGISKAWFSTLDIQQAVSVYNVFFINRDSQSLATITDITSAFCIPVPFSSLVNDTSPRRIVIDYSDTITTAALFNKGNHIKTVSINRRTSDNPSVHVAAVEAIDKLLAKQDKPTKKTSKPESPAEKDGFKVGDRVVINAPKPGNAHDAHGKHGAIVSLENKDYGENMFAVELDEPVYGHNCAGQTKPGHGCWVEAEQLLHEQPTKPQVREVKRRAKAGEWVKVVNAYHFADENYRNGDILQVTKNNSVLDRLSCGGVGASEGEYVVLEGYQPKGADNA